MKPTDEERREVARRLRVLASHREVDKEMFHDAIGVWPGGCIDGYDPVGVMELADLIEPKPERTCRFEERYYDDGSSPWPYYVCSECCERLHYRDIVTEYGEESCEMLPYCAGCGARVEGVAK